MGGMQGAIQQPMMQTPMPNLFMNEDPFAMNSSFMSQKSPFENTQKEIEALKQESDKMLSDPSKNPFLSSENVSLTPNPERLINNVYHSSTQYNSSYNQEFM